MRFQRILEQVYQRPWFITAEGHAAVAQLVESRLAVKSDIAEGLKEFCIQREPLRVDDNNIAHVHILGVLGLGLAPIEKACGNTDYADIAADIAAAAGARAFMFRIDSPGGMCAGCVDTARLIAAISVPKIAHASAMMCSAAYAMGVGCDQLYSTESALVGSIGTICPWVDSSVAWEKMGISFQPVTNTGADLKASGHGPALTEEQRAGMQELVNDYSGQFTGHVRTYRNPSPEVFRGGAYAGTRALQYGLVDALVSEGEAYATLLQN